jgi:hypothetical protein
LSNRPPLTVTLVHVSHADDARRRRKAAEIMLTVALRVERHEEAPALLEEAAVTKRVPHPRNRKAG